MAKKASNRPEKPTCKVEDGRLAEQLPTVSHDIDKVLDNFTDNTNINDAVDYAQRAGVIAGASMVLPVTDEQDKLARQRISSLAANVGKAAKDAINKQCKVK